MMMRERSCATWHSPPSGRETTLNYPDGPGIITWSLKAGSFLQLVGEGKLESKHEKDSMHHCSLKTEGATWQGMWVTSRSWDELLANSQENGVLSSTTRKNWVPPPTWMTLEIDFYLEPPNKRPIQLNLDCGFVIPWAQNPAEFTTLLAFRASKWMLS